jgi:hypothetical protein
MQRVRVKKVGAVEQPLCETPDWDSYVLGVENPDVSLPIEYEIEGTPLNEPTVGESYRVLRYVRNGVKTLGGFSTSIVKRISTDGNRTILETCNSIYIVENI